MTSPSLYLSKSECKQEPDQVVKGDIRQIAAKHLLHKSVGFHRRKRRAAM